MYGICSLLRKAARYYPDRTALADPSGAVSYAEFEDRTNRLANSLIALGLGKGSRIGFVCDNCNEFSVMWFAAQKAGIVTVLLNYRMTREELSRDVRRAGCRALFYAPKWRDIILGRDTSGSGVEHQITFGGVAPNGHLCLDELTASGSPEPPGVDICETDWSTILYTSGSTGLSKGVIRTQRMIYDYAMQMAAEHEFYKTEHISILSHSPLFHTGGLSMLLKSVALCGTYVGVNGVEPDVYAELIRKYSVTQLFLVPPVNIMRLYNDESFRRQSFGSVNFIWATGGKLSTEYVQAMQELFPGVRIKTSYGGTEFCAACSMSLYFTRELLEQQPDIVDSAGWIGQFIDVRIVHDDGTEAAPGEPGELLVSSPFVMLGYLDDPGETGKVLRDGWYSTGDVFRIDERGLFFFLDRKSAMIKTGGENVYPNEVESVLREHPDIVDCAVVGLPDPKWGEAVAAAVVPNSDSLDLREVVAYTRQKLAGFKKPLYYTVLPDLPRMGSGKIDRRALLDEAKYRFTGIDEICREL